MLDYVDVFPLKLKVDSIKRFENVQKFSQ